MEQEERVICNQTQCANKNCAHRCWHNFFKVHCLRLHQYSKCKDTRCVPYGFVYVEDEYEVSLSVQSA